MMTLGWPWPILQQGQIQSLGLLYGKRANSGFFWSYSSLWHQSWYLQSAKWLFIDTKVQGHLLAFVLDASDTEFLYSSLNVLGSGGSYRISDRPSLSSSIFSKDISSETAGPIETKLHVESLLDGGMKVCSCDLGHMIKIADMPIYRGLSTRLACQMVVFPQT